MWAPFGHLLCRSWRRVQTTTSSSNIGPVVWIVTTCLKHRRFPKIDSCLFSSSIWGPIALPASLQRGSVLNQPPRLFGKDDAPILVLFNSEDQAKSAPGDGSMELIPVCPGGHRCPAIGAVALHSVPGRPGISERGSFHSQIRIAVVDVQGDITCPPWRAAFIALFPCSSKIRARWRADCGRGG
jgi:hypothetical protein